MSAAGFDMVDVLELSLSHCIFGFEKMADQLEQLEGLLRARLDSERRVVAGGDGVRPLLSQGPGRGPPSGCHLSGPKGRAGGEHQSGYHRRFKARCWLPGLGAGSRVRFG